jgi:phage gpG-like protein
MAGRDDSGVRTEGFRELSRDLRKLEPAVDKKLRGDVKEIAGRVAAEARAAAVKRTGKYAASIRPYVTARGASIGSRLPQAGVLHYGGTIRPRGVDITIPARPVVSVALDRNTDRIVDQMGDAVEEAARAAGWH